MPSMGKDATSGSSRSTRDGSASGGFLYKASNSLKRSPSKRHKNQSSNPLPSLDQVFFDTQKSQASEHNPLLQKRPDVYRTQTAPLDTQITKASLKEGKTPHSAVEATMIVASFGSNHKRDTPAPLNKGASAVPQNGEQTFNGSMGGDASYSVQAHVSGSQNPKILYQHIHDMASKRISTLDYFRKAYASLRCNQCIHRVHLALTILQPRRPCLLV